MLEHHGLWLGPWSALSQAGGEPVSCQRSLYDAGRRTLLGTVRQVDVRGWWPPLTRLTLEVHESQDDSLLFTMSQRWALGESWLVADADRRRLGKLCGNLLRDAFGRRLALVETLDGSKFGRWRDLEGRELGTFTEAEQGVLATFDLTAAENPFVRMLLLATLLRLHQPR
jgi:hypothetical protein